MHNSTKNYLLYYDTYIRVIFFQEVTVLVMKGFVHHLRLSHACRQAILRSAVFYRESHPQIFIFTDVNTTIRHLSHDWSCYRGSTVVETQKNCVAASFHIFRSSNCWSIALLIFFYNQPTSYMWTSPIA
jgi:hypothetical protein